MQTLAVDGWTGRHGRAATAARYQTLAQGGADRCRCAKCRNVVLQRSTIFPAEFLRLLEQLGTNAVEERAVHGCGPASNGLRRCAGHSSFVGSLARPEADAGASSGDTRFGSGFTDGLDPLGVAVREPELFVEFAASLPWLLPDEDADDRAGDA